MMHSLFMRLLGRRRMVAVKEPGCGVFHVEPHQAAPYRAMGWQCVEVWA